MGRGAALPEAAVMAPASLLLVLLLESIFMV